MLDTAGSGTGSLVTHLGLREIACFITEARAHGLMVGVAGSIAVADVPELLRLRRISSAFVGRFATAPATHLSMLRHARPSVP